MRRLAGGQFRGALKPLLKVQRQLLGLRREAHAVRLGLSRLERRLSRLRGRLGPGSTAAAGRRGRPLSGDSIRRVRDRLRMTREQFARALDVSPGSVFGWESGRTVPRDRSLSRFEELRKMGVRQARARFKAARPARRPRGKGRRRAPGARRRRPRS